MNIELARLPCFICGASLTVYKMSGEDTDCPDLVSFTLSDTSWVGVIRDEEGGEPWLLVLCSAKCAGVIAMGGKEKDIVETSQ